MVQLSGEHGVIVKGREDVNQSGSALGRGVAGLAMTQSTPLAGSTSINNNNGEGGGGGVGVTLQLNADAFVHSPQGNGSPGKAFANGDVVKNGFPGRNPPLAAAPSVGRSSATSASVRPQEYPRPSARLRRERDAPAGGGDRHRDRRGGDRDRDPRDRSDRWSYYGDPRVRPDQHFLRDSDDRRGAYRDDRHRRDVRDRRDRRDPRDDRRRPPESDRDRYPPYDRDRNDRKRDPELDGSQDRDRYPPRDRDDRRESREPEGVGRIKEERQESEGNEDGSREEEPDSPETSEEREVEDERDKSLGQARDHDGDAETDRERDQEGRDRDHRRDPEDYRRDRDRSYERRRRRDYDRERDRSYERERERDRDLGRDRDHQPRRREPVGEETGYDSDHSRASRATAVSYSTRSLGRRPRPESVVSLASLGSHASGRPPPAPRTSRGTRGYEDAYGSRELYDQYQYYYQYYRDHPYYKEYYRQWMKQYGHAYPSHESFYDDRTSIHSGRSSVNDELKKSISSQFMQDSYGRASVGAYEPSAIYPDGSYSHLKSYASGELSGVPSVGGDSASEAPQRLTPVQHGRPHINARFTPGGGLLFVLPKDPRDGEKAIVQIRDVQKMLCMDPALSRCVRQMKGYPGPLTLADTHKDVVVRYCEQQAAEAARNQALPDGESVTLIWEYLALLVKQNGKLYGSDVAGLLLKGQDKAFQPQHKRSASTVSTENAAETSPSEGTPQEEGIDLMSQSTPLSPPRDESILLKKFTEYLCLGRKKEAVDYAMREGLWGHALALSFKMDSTTHTRVLAAFSSDIPRNDVLLTLFQQLSGKRPEVTKNYTPQQWGSWRHHLAMMVSNPTGQSHRDKASIISLGETLASRGQLHAAHFCYLVAEAEWGSFSSKESKLVLIGSSHQHPFQAFATNEAIQCTEIYEFARSLDSSNPVLETFQSYKLIYALRLAEYGFPSEALRYCEVISQIVSKNPNSYQGDFLSQVYELASRLKYHDLHYHMCEGEVAEMPDPQWLSNLRAVVDAVKHQEQLTMQDYYNQGYTTASAYQGSGATPDLYNQTAGTSTTDYSQGYSVTDTSYQHSQSTPDPYQGHVASGDVMDGAYPHQHSSVYPAASQTPAEGMHTPVNPSEVNQSSDSGSHAQENSSPQMGNVPMMMQPQEDQSQYASYGSNYWPGYPPQDPNASSSYRQSEVVEATHSSLPASPEVSSDHQQNSISSVSQPNSLSSYPTYQQPYQSWDQQQHTTSNSTNDEPQSRSPEASEVSQRTPEEEAYWAEMTGKKGSNDAKILKKCGQEGTLKEEHVQPTKIENKSKRVSFKSQKSNDTTETVSKENEKPEDDKKKEKDSESSQDKNSGWSIGSLFGWKKSKQAVLPDDKNPSIVWNEEKKRWENKDGGDEVNSPPPPPPKMSVGVPGAPPLSLARPGNRKSRYVNTEKESKQSSNSPSPMMPPPLPGGPPVPGAPSVMSGGAPMPPNFMVPAPMPQQQERESNSPQQSQTAQNPEQQIPSQPQAPPASLPDSSLGTSNDGGEGAVPMMAPPGQPQFFNPSQFNQSSPPNPAQTRRVGPGRRLNQGKR